MESRRSHTRSPFLTDYRRCLLRPLTPTRRRPRPPAAGGARDWGFPLFGSVFVVSQSDERRITHSGREKEGTGSADSAAFKVETS